MKKWRLLLVFAIVGTMFLGGCGQEIGDAGGLTKENFAESGDLLDYSKGSLEESTSDSKEIDVKNNRKIIETVELHAQTKEFDKLIKKIDEEIKKVDGYIESSSVTGDNFEEEESRYAQMTIRVPAEKSKEFTEFVSGNSTITNKEISTEDVTLSYVDLESRVSALETEKTTLERLLSEATNMDDIIKIQDRLTDVIYEIESVKSQLKTYDNLVDYTTITLYIDEVERVTITEKQTVWQEIVNNWKQAISDVSHFFVRLFVFILSLIPYVVGIFGMPAIIAVGILVCIKKRKKKIDKEISKNKEQEQNNAEK